MGRGKTKAELTTPEEKLAEVLGLAQAARGATGKVESLVDDPSADELLQQMRAEAEETARRCTEVADRVKAAYAPATYERLVALNDTYDLGNVFRVNQNIALRP